MRVRVHDRVKHELTSALSVAGVFEMVCKYDKNNIEKHILKLDDLLEKSFNQVEKIDLPRISLDVNGTLYLLNKYILA